LFLSTKLGPAKAVRTHLTGQQTGQSNNNQLETLLVELHFPFIMPPSEWTPRAVLTAVFLGAAMGFQTSCVAFAEFLSFLIRPLSAKWANVYLAHLMELWSQHLVFMIQYFAPGSFVITVDKSCTSWVKSDGTTTDIGIEEMIRRKSDGTIDTLAFPPRLVFISNHQVCMVTG
jgi:hypothetical protein